MAAIFVLGFFLDYIEIIFVIVPLVGPVLIANGADPLWLGILISLNLQTSFMTPPFGFSLFFLRGVAPKEIETQPPCAIVSFNECVQPDAQVGLHTLHATLACSICTVAGAVSICCKLLSESTRVLFARLQYMPLEYDMG